MSSEIDLFSTVPKEKRIEALFDENHDVNVKGLLEFLDLSRGDLAAVFDVKVDSVRFDERMPSEMKDWCIATANICELVGKYFGKGNDVKAKTWFKVPNPLLDGECPLDFIKTGRTKDLESRVVGSLVIKK